MAEFEAKTNQLMKNADSVNAVFLKINSLSGQIRSVSQKIHLDAASESIIRNNLDSMAEINQENAAKGKTLSDTLNNIAVHYDETEQRIRNHESAGSKESIIKQILKDKWKIEGSIVGKEITKMGTILGMEASGTAEAELIGGSVKTKSKAKWDFEKGDAGIEKSIEAEGHVAKGKLKGNIGLFGGEIGASVGNIGASGKIGATLFKNGKLAPSLDAKLKAEASAVKGDAEVKAGNDEHNVHIKGSGTLLGAEAEASGSAGVISYKDEATGQTRSELGVKGKVGAEAYLAQGKIAGGFTIFGIRFDAGISGKAGGAGISAEGRATTGGVSGKIGAGLGLGGGLEISIDWSKFSLW